MQVSRIDHVAIAVEALKPVLDLLSFLGLKLEWQEDLSDQGLRSSMVAADNAHIELLESVEPDSVVARFLEQRGPGLHHVCLEVDNLDAAIAEVKARGLRLVEEIPRADQVGRRVFLHPASAYGVLIGLVERHRSGDEPKKR